MNKPEIAVLILSRDKASFIEPCVESLLRHLRDIDFEIVIGDTGSTDEYALQYYNEVTEKSGSQVRIVHLGTYHFGKNYNALVEETRAEKILLLNNDTFATDNFLRRMLRLQSQQKKSIVGAKLLYHDDTVQHAGVAFLTTAQNETSGFHPYQGRRAGMPEINYIAEVPAVTGACMLLDKRTFKAAGGFTEAYAEECQDTDLCLKIRESGGKSYYNPLATLYHFENGSRKTSENAKDRSLFDKTWGDYLRSRIMTTNQRIPIGAKVKSRRNVVFIRPAARGDVFASTAIVQAYKKKNPDTRITFKTKFPDLVDQVPFIDRALHLEDYDGENYAEEIHLDYESGDWREHPISWLHEMARKADIPLPAKQAIRPVFQLTSLDRQRLTYLEQSLKDEQYVVISSGAGWAEKRWTNTKWDQLVQKLSALGLRSYQIGGTGDYLISGARHMIDRRLEENICVIQNAVACVLLDSFPLHLAMSVNKPTVFLSCKTCTYTGYLTPEVIQLRHTEAQTTPLPACKTQGCRLKFGNATENHCANPILYDLPVENVIETLSGFPDFKRALKDA